MATFRLPRRGGASSQRHVRMHLVALALTLGALTTQCSEPVTIGAIDEAPFERVALEHEWRQARPVAPGRHAIEIGPVASGDFLRIGALPRADSKTGVRLQLTIDDRQILDVQHADTDAWIHRTIHFDEESMIGKIATLEAQSDHGFWLAPFELRHGRSEQPNVLIFLIDTLRQDHLGVYGYPFRTSPNIDRFARDAVRFDRVVAQAPWTRPSVASLMTSTHPQVHGVLTRRDVMRALPTLAGALDARGYESHGFFSNPNILPTFGFGREFFRYVDCDSNAWKQEDASDKRVIDEVLSTLDMARGRPWFFYVHTMGPHWPYTAPPEIVPALSKGRRRRDRTSLGYDAEIAVVDRHFGRLMKTLESMGLYEQSLIIVTSDHGQELWERGFHQHGHNLHREQLNVPFLVKLPGNRLAGEVRGDLLEMADVAPTLLETLGLAPEDAFQGRSFAELLDDRIVRETDPRRTAYASTFLEGLEQHTIQRGDVKYIQDRHTGEASWYDISIDQWEKKPLDRSPQGVQDLMAVVESHATKSASGPHLYIQGSLDPKQRLIGTIIGADIVSHLLTTHWRPHTSSQDGDTITFEIGGDGNEGDGKGGPAVGHADLRIEVSGDAPLVVSLAVDGKPLPAERVSVGAENLARELNGAHFELEAIEGFPTRLQLGWRDQPITAFLWQIPAGERIEDEDLPPETRESLEALGYIE